jgi:hypothetical protein
MFFVLLCQLCSASATRSLEKTITAPTPTSRMPAPSVDIFRQSLSICRAWYSEPIEQELTFERTRLLFATFKTNFSTDFARSLSLTKINVEYPDRFVWKELEKCVSLFNSMNIHITPDDSLSLLIPEFASRIPYHLVINFTSKANQLEIPEWLSTLSDSAKSIKVLYNYSSRYFKKYTEKYVNQISEIVVNEEFRSEAAVDHISFLKQKNPKLIPTLNRRIYAVDYGPRIGIFEKFQIFEFPYLNQIVNFNPDFENLLIKAETIFISWNYSSHKQLFKNITRRYSGLIRSLVIAEADRDHIPFCILLKKFISEAVNLKNLQICYKDGVCKDFLNRWISDFDLGKFEGEISDRVRYARISDSVWYDDVYRPIAHPNISVLEISQYQFNVEYLIDIISNCPEIQVIYVKPVLNRIGDFMKSINCASFMEKSINWSCEVSNNQVVLWRKFVGQKKIDS